MENKDVNSIMHHRRLSSRKGAILITFSCLLILCVTLTYVSVEGIHRAHADSNSDFSQGASSSSSTQSLFWFQPSGWTAGYVILHYNQPGAPRQNLNMTYNNGTACWEYTAGGMSSGQVITYFFTYQKAGLQYDTSNYTCTFGSGGSDITPTPTVASGITPTPTVGGGVNGTFPIILQNNTRGVWANSQVYVLILGQATPGQWSYLKSDGTFVLVRARRTICRHILIRCGTTIQPTRLRSIVRA